MRLLTAVAGSVVGVVLRSRRLLALGVALSVVTLAGFYVPPQAVVKQDTSKSPTKATTSTRTGIQPTLGGQRALLPGGPQQLLGVGPYPADSITKICAQVDDSPGIAQLRALMDSLKWVVGCIPMFTDDQRLNDGSDNFGPLAHILPAPSDTFSDVTKFNVPIEKSILVGLILVDPESPMPKSYQALSLNPGFNCVYFRDTTGKQLDGWVAYVTPLRAIRAVNFCTLPTARTKPLRVTAYQDKNFRDTSDYPLIGRFREASLPGKAADHWPLFGLKCVAAFCIVSSQEMPTPPHKSEHVGVRNKRNWQVFGWNDEQHVALGSGTATPQWKFDASIIAADGLGSMKIADFERDTVLVATVFLRGKPPAGSKYEKLWHYEKGDNYIFLHHKRGSARDDDWTGVIRHTMTPSLIAKGLALVGVPYEWPLKVTRMDHSGVNVLGTARFKWSPTDDNDWARCDEGCCLVTPF